MGGNGPTSEKATPSTLSKEQLENWARQYSKALRRYFVRRGAQPATAEDLIQDVFERLSKRVSAAEIKNPEAYLMQTASSAWSDHWRKRQVRLHDDHVEYDDRYHTHVEFGADRVFEGRDGVRRLITALRELPPRTQEIFVRCRVDGEKQKAVAARFGISVSAVEKHLVRAMAHLGSKVKEDDQ